MTLPPFHLHILGLYEALDKPPCGYNYIVSLNDADYKGPFPEPLEGGTICRVHFDDVTPEDQEMFGGTVLATGDNLSEILDYSKHFAEDDLVLVHCFAGISRSSATACAILRQHGMDYEDIRAYVQTIRPIAWPNSYLLEIYDELLGCGGKLSALSDPWREEGMYEHLKHHKPPGA